jgi:hypothetical protein
VRVEGWPCFEEFGVPALHVGHEVRDGAFEVGHVEILDVGLEVNDEKEILAGLVLWLPDELIGFSGWLMDW